jgi:PadR family transcriptional regulator, regulatory protein PadR
MGQNGSELLHGTLETLILKTVVPGRRHGYGIARSIEEATDGVVEVEEGSLYPALYRLERKGLLEAEWGTSELGRRAKFYRITPRGRKLLTTQTAEWARFAGAISKVLLAAG